MEYSEGDGGSGRANGDFHIQQLLDIKISSKTFGKNGIWGTMRDLSLNVHGMKDWAKCRRIRSLVLESKVDFCMLQERKNQNMEESIVKDIWWGGDIEFWLERKKNRK